MVLWSSPHSGYGKGHCVAVMLHGYLYSPHSGYGNGHCVAVMSHGSLVFSTLRVWQMALCGSHVTWFFGIIHTQGMAKGIVWQSCHMVLWYSPHSGYGKGHCVAVMSHGSLVFSTLRVWQRALCGSHVTWFFGILHTQGMAKGIVWQSCHMVLWYSPHSGYGKGHCVAVMLHGYLYSPHSGYGNGHCVAVMSHGSLVFSILRVWQMALCGSHVTWFFGIIHTQGMAKGIVWQSCHMVLWSSPHSGYGKGHCVAVMSNGSLELSTLRVWQRALCGSHVTSFFGILHTQGMAKGTVWQSCQMVLWNYPHSGYGKGHCVAVMSHGSLVFSTLRVWQRALCGSHVTSFFGILHTEGMAIMSHPLLLHKEPMI